MDIKSTGASAFEFEDAVEVGLLGFGLVGCTTEEEDDSKGSSSRLACFDLEGGFSQVSRLMRLRFFVLVEELEVVSKALTATTTSPLDCNNASTIAP